MRTKYFDRNLPIKIEERFPAEFSSVSIASFCGSTFSGPVRSRPPEEFILDATYLERDSRGISLAGGDGYEHPLSLVRQEEISRVAYFGNKHLVRLARTFDRPEDLNQNCYGLFHEAAREAAAKSGSIERSSATLIRAFFAERSAKNAKVVVGSVGDVLVFAYDPRGENVTWLALPRRYPDGFGGFSPISFTDSDLSEDQMVRGIFELPLGTFIFYMTDGVWETLDYTVQEGSCQISCPDRAKLTTFLRAAQKESNVTPSAIDYRDQWKARCVERAEASRQELLTKDTDNAAMPVVGDDATLLIVKLERA